MLISTISTRWTTPNLPILIGQKKRLATRERNRVEIEQMKILLYLIY